MAYSSSRWLVWGWSYKAVKELIVNLRSSVNGSMLLSGLDRVCLLSTQRGVAALLVASRAKSVVLRGENISRSLNYRQEERR